MGKGCISHYNLLMKLAYNIITCAEVPSKQYDHRDVVDGVNSIEKLNIN